MVGISTRCAKKVEWLTGFWLQIFEYRLAAIRVRLLS